MDPITVVILIASIVGTIGGVVGGLVLIAKFAMGVGSWKTTMEHMQRSLDKIQKNHEDFQRDVLKEFVNLTARVVSVENSIGFLRDAPTLGSKNASPRVLSELGEEISESIDAKGIAQSLARDLVKHTKEMERYDIQQLCYEHIRSEFKPSPKLEKLLKDAAYENGVDMRTVLEVLAIELRDELLGTEKKKRRNKR